MTAGEYFEGKNISIMHMVDDELLQENFTPHMHDRYELFCLVRGEVDYAVEGNVYLLEPGSMMLMRSAETHKLLVRGSGAYERYVIYFTPEFFSEKGFTHELLAPFTSRGLGERNLYAPADFGGVPPLFYLRKMFRERECLPLELAAAASLSALLSAACHIFMHGRTEATAQNGSGRELLAYVNENLTKKISLEKISASVHMSCSQVNRIFRRLTGTSVYDYIVSKRLILAQERMAKGENASAAASACGFRDYSSFYRLYKKR
ncbi:MAG: helix-turn-helix transcriptional regulator, partial [Clostridia bacterium]|nr:helix-turn-helix transcriptional regulator [Clostridia bacterium]